MTVSGLAILLRWNLSAAHYTNNISMVLSSALATGIEMVEGYIDFRSREFADFLAGAVGAAIGVASVVWILSFPDPKRTLGVVIAGLGVTLTCMFPLADSIGIGLGENFGPTQPIGIALAILMVAGGLAVLWLASDQ